jgi:lysophospholipase L1-like esterase
MRGAVATWWGVAFATVTAGGCPADPAAVSRELGDRGGGPSATIASEWIAKRSGEEASEGTAAASAAGSPVVQGSRDAVRDAWVLHVGDSFVDASFQQNLRPRFRESGSRYISRSAVATYTTTWAYDPAFDAWLARKPALVIVTLGANEADIPVPEEHAKPIALIARKIAAAGAACVWTTPPLWRHDTGIVQVIHDHAAPCLFFESDAVMGSPLSLAERNPDRIHPNPKGGARWTSAFWTWLQSHRDPSGGPWALRPFEPRDPRDPRQFAAPGSSSSP